MTEPLPNRPTHTVDADSRFALFDEVMAHLRACTVNEGNISDHWRHTLDQRGRTHEYDDLVNMLAPGNPVNARIRNAEYLVDASILDPGDAVQAFQMSNGEPDFGAPSRIIHADGSRYSSAFVTTVPLSARLAREIERLDVARPTVVEIGGGLGLLAYQLLAYFGNRIRLVAIDIPEILHLQEWYLRNCLPHLKTAFVATAGDPLPEDADVVFVNAHAVNDLDIAMDFAVNINSFQDMSAEVANGYVKYVEAHISDGGIFHVQNTTGQSTTSVDEPGRYEFDSHWSVIELGLVETIETSLPGTELRLVLRRTGSGADTALRRDIFDFCWHGLNVGSPWTQTDAIAEMLDWPLSQAGTPLAGIIAGTPLADAYAEYLATPARAFSDPNAVALPAVGSSPEPLAFGNVFRWAQAAVIAEMEHAIAAGDTADHVAVQAAARTICEQAEDRLRRLGVAASEYWSAYLASFLSGLGATDLAAGMLADVVPNASTAPWRLRLARLALMDGHTGLAREFVMDNGSGETTTFDAKFDILDIRCRLGDTDTVVAELAYILDDARTPAAHLDPIGRILIRAGDADGIEHTVSRALATPGEGARQTAYDLIAAASGIEAVNSRKLWEAAETGTGSASLSVNISRARAQWLVDDRSAATEAFTRLAEQAWQRYYDLGRLGKVLISLGDEKLGGTCLQRSIHLKPDNFMHYEFVGETYMDAGLFEKAANYFSLVAEMKPYMRHILGRVAFCRLPHHIQDAGVFGRADRLCMIFQQQQNYYS